MTNAASDCTSTSGRATISRRASKSTNRMTIGTTLMARAWLETHSPASRAPMRPPRERPDRDEAGQLAHQRVEGIAGRVEDTEARQQQLRFRPVPEADPRQERPRVDDRRDRE